MFPLSTSGLLLSGSLLLSLRVAAQAPTTPAPTKHWFLTGSVQTEQAVPLAGAKVVAVNMQSGQRQLVATGRRGNFQLESLPAGGPYLVEVLLKGYQPQVISSLYVNPDRTVQLSFSLVPVPAMTVAALHVERPLLR